MDHTGLLDRTYRDCSQSSHDDEHFVEVCEDVPLGRKNGGEKTHEEPGEEE